METNHKNRNGFTLIELVITITIIGILSLVASGIINIGINSFIFISTHSALTRKAQDAINILFENILKANPDGINTARNNRFYFTNMNGDEIQFQYNRRNDCLRYRVVGQSNWREILNNISRNEFSFFYFNIDGSFWNKKEKLKRVGIKFTLNIAEENETYQAEIYIRN